MITAPIIQELILSIEDIREEAETEHNEVIDEILTKVRQTLKVAQENDLSVSMTDLRISEAMKVVVEELAIKACQLTGRAG